MKSSEAFFDKTVRSNVFHDLKQGVLIYIISELTKKLRDSSVCQIVWGYISTFLWKLTYRSKMQAVYYDPYLYVLLDSDF